MRVSIREVVITLVEAMVLVFLVVFLFLQNWRATLIPFTAVPVSLIGTFAGLLLLGYSINTLTLFGMVLAIGIVVDDAIVVLENVERIMREEHLDAREAAIKAMHEVTSPIIAIVLTLCAVFVPIAFLGGLTGELYRQFAVTISIAVVISGLVALTLTPEPVRADPEARAPPARPLLPLVQRLFRRVTGRYTDGVAWMLRRGMVALVLFAGMVAITVGLWRATPGSLVPDEDQGYYIAAVFLPDGATLERTDKVVNEVVETIKSNPANEYAIAFTGFDFLGGGFRNSAATIFVTQKHWDERKVDHAAAGRRVLHEDRAHQGSAGARVQSAADLRPGQRRRLRVLHPEPRRRRRAAPVRSHAAVPRRRAERSACSGRSTRCGAPTCRSSTSRPTAKKRRRSACRSTSSTTRSPRRSARTTSTTSTSTAAPGRC